MGTSYFFQMCRRRLLLLRSGTVFVLVWACIALFFGRFQFESIRLPAFDTDEDATTATKPVAIAIANTTTGKFQPEEAWNQTAIGNTAAKFQADDDSSPSLQQQGRKFPPLIIGAAQGTTGTHTLHDAMCCLRIPSTHYANDCWILRMGKKKDVCNQNGNRNVDFGIAYDKVYHYKRGNLDGLKQKEIMELTFDKERNHKLPNPHPHIRLFWYAFEMISCIDAEQRRTQKDQCPPKGTDDMARWAEGLKALIDEVLRWHEDDDNGDSILNAGAINDTPFTFVLPYVIESAKRHRGQAPFLLLLERNPVEWSNRRSESHNHLLCRIDLVHGYDQNVPPASHFDWFDCIERTIRAKEETLGVVGATVDMYKVFTSSGNLKRGVDQPKGKEWSMEDLNKHMAVVFEKHQNFWRTQSDLHWNMFEHKITAMDIALKAHELFESSGTFEKSEM